MPRGTPNRKPDTDTADEDSGQPQRSRLPAGSQPPPATSGASSVFALGRQAKPAAAPRGPRIDPAAVAIKRGVPIPPAEFGVGVESPYVVLLKRMQAGDMVELPYRQAYGLISMAKKLKIGITRRKLGADTFGIWRT